MKKLTLALFMLFVFCNISFAIPVLPSTDVKTLGSFTNYAHWLTFDGKTPVVDTSAKEFYLSVP
ncbi:MAG: hypothetical protein PHQ68_07555, partial [Parabacteroides sp.]|nr:hypothetical protein [Parabacteroides sp.]